MFEQFIQKYNEAIYDTDRDQAMKVVQDALDTGAAPEEIIFKLVVPAMGAMIKSVSEDFDANLAQHFMTAQIASEVTDQMLKRIEKPPQPLGRIIIGTAEGDIHSLGKKIVIGCLRALLIESIDLGVNVAPERFVDEAVERGVNVIGISAMMVHTAIGKRGPRAVKALLRKRGLDGQIKLILGGAPFHFAPELIKAIGADAVAPDGMAGAEIIKSIIEETD